jgi:Fe-S-cluster-containing dehydrogenase component
MAPAHPTLQLLAEHPPAPAPEAVDAAWLEAVARSAGADDVAFIPLDHPALAGEVGPVREALATTQTLCAYVVRMGRGAVRSPTRSVANGEFHRTTDRAALVGDAIVRALEDLGVAALHPSAGFPMEMDRFPGRTWVVSHKVVAEAAGLGRIGLHRNVIHPRFGSFILLGTVMIAARVDAPLRTLDYNPCVDCRLCVAACPVGAIRSDGFDFSACLTHNYREFMGGFNDWVGTVAESGDRWDYRKKVSQSETASWWQSLTTGPHYKAAYCVAACPAGSEVMGPYLADKKRFVADVVEPLRAKAEPVYVMPGTDAEAHVAARYPHKTIRRVEGGLFADSIPGFIRGAPLLFQAKKAKALALRVAFRFTGADATDVTFEIDHGVLRVHTNIAPNPDVTVTVDGALWLDLLNGRRNPVWLVLTGRMSIAGDRRTLDAFQGCFPGRV